MRLVKCATLISIGELFVVACSVFILSTYHLLLLRAIPFSLNQKHCNLLLKSLTASPRRNATLLVASHSIAACANSHVRIIGLEVYPLYELPENGQSERRHRERIRIDA